MAINFDIIGSSFTGNPISAYFITDKKELVIIDCPISTVEKLKLIKLRSYKHVYVLITHSELDYFREIGLLAAHLKKNITIVLPDQGTVTAIYNILAVNNIRYSKCKLVEPSYLLPNKFSWFERPIQMISSQRSKCYAYHLLINNFHFFYAVGVQELNSLSYILSDNSLLAIDSEMFKKIKHTDSAEIKGLATSLKNEDITVNVMEILDIMTLVQPEEYVTSI